MKKIILFVLSLLFGLMFINAGLNKFFNYMPVPKDLPEGMMKVMTAFMTIGWLMPLIAVAEIVGGVLFIIPKYRALGAIIILPIMIGIILTHLTLAPSGLPMALVLFAINIWVIIENREKYLPMIK
ncbi:DoxX family membrane protein [Pedobacter hiemivivus]|uniref:DoxX family membrane protein n=1 Tax=Pedobacter hiemivivus TaxID=2530454 RepID=A0A4V5PBK5_9SPHI|nr:DoxX family membrane protein [Pedobacter hiemivivus]TKC56196.1 DoxX family membrane protein [Pedobacter hiemivivus]